MERKKGTKKNMNNRKQNAGKKEQKRKKGRWK